MAYQFLRSTFFTNGSTIKHLPNRSVTVATNPNKIGGAIIEFRKADCPKEELHTSHHVDHVLRDKVKLSGLAINFYP